MWRGTRWGFGEPPIVAPAERGALSVRASNAEGGIGHRHEIGICFSIENGNSQNTDLWGDSADDTDKQEARDAWESVALIPICISV